MLSTSEKVCPLGRKSDRRGAKRQGCTPPVFLLLLSESRRALQSPLPYFIRFFLHTAFLTTLNIFIIPLRVADELLWLHFHYWTECKRPDGDRRGEKEITVSNSVRQQQVHGCKNDGGKTVHGSDQYAFFLIKQAGWIKYLYFPSMVCGPTNKLLCAQPRDSIRLVSRNK